ncbi:hypothetical protein Poli38472_011819 [Pythium oligandrum]|uniref:Uncharacterized protein n=1 Tax=Pythium oligandrum TaxID=41045 RepID=A0A8K1FDE1_PYTOL|nr:hypothetical protein Poli38472_011819 [Pythium oligandrum]|eukprot:TMW58231.1 hypothetical protein Poli38472_011819 [Pythium oligandrum]
MAPTCRRTTEIEFPMWDAFLMALESDAPFVGHQWTMYDGSRTSAFNTLGVRCLHTGCNARVNASLRKRTGGRLPVCARLRDVKSHAVDVIAEGDDVDDATSDVVVDLTHSTIPDEPVDGDDTLDQDDKSFNTQDIDALAPDEPETDTQEAPDLVDFGFDAEEEEEEENYVFEPIEDPVKPSVDPRDNNSTAAIEHILVLLLLVTLAVITHFVCMY